MNSANANSNTSCLLSLSTCFHSRVGIRNIIFPIRTIKRFDGKKTEWLGANFYLPCNSPLFSFNHSNERKCESLSFVCAPNGIHSIRVHGLMMADLFLSYLSFIIRRENVFLRIKHFCRKVWLPSRFLYPRRFYLLNNWNKQKFIESYQS